LPVSREGFDLWAGEPSDEGTDATRRGHQGRGLAFDGLEVGLLGAGHVENLDQLPDLAFTQQADGRCEERRHFRAEGGGDLRGTGKKEVAGQDGDEVAPPGVDALDPTARE